MKIWVYINGLQQGPYTFEQVGMLDIGPDTPVWYEGLPGWLPASQAPLTAPMFGAAPQATAGAGAYGYTAPAGAEPQAAPPRPSTYIVWCVILTILCCSPFAIAGIATGAISSSRYNSGDYEGAKSMSTATEWLVILSIVWAVAGLPIAMASGCTGVL